MFEVKRIRFVNSEVLDKLILAFIPLDKQMQLSKEQLEALIDTVEEEVILKKAKDIQELRNKNSTT